MKNYAKLGQELQSLLRLKIAPIGIKFFPRTSDIPRDFEVMSETCVVCQVIAKARFHEKAVASTKDAATVCGMGGAVLGLFDIAPDVADGTRNVGRWAKTVEATKKLAQNRMMIEKGKFEAFGVAPLKIMSVEPDVIQVWGTPAQMLQLAYANIWDGSDNLELSTNGHGASCYETLAYPYLSGKVRLAVADIGDRRFAWAADDEMICGFPLSHLERLTDNLKESYTPPAVYKYPYEYYMFPIWPKAIERAH
jgi:uncharacterized protein (DUF169 family)